jgi:hypothetical protein
MHFSGSATGRPGTPPAADAAVLPRRGRPNQGLCTTGSSMKVATSALRNTR